MLKTSMILLLLALITACSTNYPLSTNLDKQNFNQYFAAAAVEIYETEQDMPNKHLFIGLVEGQDCQKEAHLAAPDKINARTQARQQAFNKNANAVVFTGCADFSAEQLAQLNLSNDAHQCHAIIICYGRAFAVATDVQAK